MNNTNYNNNNLSSPSSVFQLHKQSPKFSEQSGNSSIEKDTVSQLSQPVSETSSLNSEINVEKYHRLATEFAKLRAQFLVLKKAVVEEQTKNDELQELTKNKDQCVRRLEQEVESLTFRNQQLSKRVSVLQTDLEEGKKPGTSPNVGSNSVPNRSRARSFLFSGGSGGGEGGSDTISNSSLLSNSDAFEEVNLKLKTKIEENEWLQETIAEMKQKHFEEVEKLQHLLKQSTKQSKKELDQATQQICSFNQTLFTLRGEKNTLEKKVAELQTDLQDTRTTLDNLKFENKNLKSRLENFEQLILSKQHQQQIQQQSISFQRQESFHSPHSHYHKSSIPVSITSANKSYQDLIVRQRITEEFVSKLSEFICALSTLHSNVSQKISIMFALFNKNCNHLYFLDLNCSNTETSSTSGGGSDKCNPPSPVPTSTTNDCDQSPNNIVGSYRSMLIMSILRKFADYLKSGYDTHLVHLEDAIQQYSDNKLRHQKLTQGSINGTDGNAKSNNVESQAELSLIEQQLTETSIEIGETLTDYVSYLNKINPYIAICLNSWCKILRNYDPKNKVITTVLDPSVQSHLADSERRNRLCEKNELLMNSTTACIRIIGQICNYTQLLLSKSLLKSNFLSVFNHLMHRVNALEKSFDETKRMFSSKVVLEHDLGVTVETDLRSVDDCILSSLVFVSKCVTEIRLMLETHYFFFVDQSSANSPNNGQVLELSERTDEDSDDDDDVQEETVYDDDNVEEEGEEHIGASINHLKDQKRFAVGLTPTTKQPKANSGAKFQFSKVNSSNSSSPSPLGFDNNLETKLKIYQNKLFEVEREKEHWSIESQLNQVKLEREQKKIAELEARIQSLTEQLKQTNVSNIVRSSSDNFRQLTASIDRANSSHTLSQSTSVENNGNYVEFGSVSTTSGLQSPIQSDRFSHYMYGEESVASNKNNNLSQTSGGGETEGDPKISQQQVAIDYLRQKITKLIESLQLSDGRAAAYQNDCTALRQRLAFLSEAKDATEQNVMKQKDELDCIQEEYRTSVENYETQLRTMSEHLASLNELLTSQQEEIDLLKYQQQQQKEQEQQSAKKSTSSNIVTKNFRKNFKR